MRPTIENSAMRSASLLVVSALLAARVGQAAPSGPEFQVNSGTLRDQGYPAACISGADAVVAWESRGERGAGAVVTRRFTGGAPATDDVVLDALDAGPVQAPAVACADDGSYVVVWERREGVDYDIAARRVGSDGAPLSTLLPITTAAGRQRAAAVCDDGAGNFVVAWQSDGQDGDGSAVVARRFTSDGTPRGDEAIVNQTSAGSQQHPAIACDASGNFAVAWESRGQDGDGGAIVARRYDATGVGGDEVRLNSTAAGDQRLPAIATLPGDGGYLVAWESEGQDGDESGIFARRVDAALTPLGGETQVNSAAIYSQEQPAVAVSGGGIVVAWSSPGDGDGYGIFARRLGSDGQPLGAEALVNVATAGTQGAISDEGGGVAAAGNAAGATLVAWQSLRLTGPAPDGDGMGVFARAGLPAGCAGDCDGDGAVAIDELIRGVGLALDDGSAAVCAALDADGDDRIVIAELIAAVAAALNGCDHG